MGIFLQVMMLQSMPKDMVQELMYNSSTELVYNSRENSK